MDVDKPDDQVEGWGEEEAHEKVPVSDWYLRGTDGPPYNSDSGELINIDESKGWLPIGIFYIVLSGE